MFGIMAGTWMIFTSSARTKRRCVAWRKIEQLLAPRGLELNQKTQIFPLRNGLDFLGFHTYLTDSGKVIRKVRRSSKDRMRRKLRKYAVMYENGAMTRKQIEESYQSWRAHASHGQCRSLITKYDAVCASIFERSVTSNHAAEDQQPSCPGKGQRYEHQILRRPHRICDRR